MGTWTLGDVSDFLRAPSGDRIGFVQRMDPSTAPDLEALAVIVRVVRIARKLVEMNALAAAPIAVVHFAESAAPSIVADACDAAGAHLLCGTLVTAGLSPRSYDEQRTERLVDAAMMRIAQAFAGEAKLGFPPALADVTSASAWFIDPTRRPRDDNADEARYWPAVLTLGAYLGEHLRRELAGGTWRLGASEHSLFTFHTPRGTFTNALAKARKHLAVGEPDGMAAFVKSVVARERDAKPA